MATKKKKVSYTKRQLKADQKFTHKIAAAWAKAGYPEKGITVDGVHYTPLDFGPEYRTQRMAEIERGGARK